MKAFESWKRFHAGATADDYAATHPYTFTYPTVVGPEVDRFESAELLLYFASGWSKCECQPLFVAGPNDVRSA